MSAVRLAASMFAYPWDLADEGLDQSLAAIADLAGCQEVLLTPSYHVATFLLPHNPVRPVYYGEDGAVYFVPREQLYAGTSIRPRVSNLVAGAGYFDNIVDAIRRRGLRFGAWIVYLYNHHLAQKHPELAKHDAFGNPYLAQLSAAAPDVGEYAAALTQDIVQRYRPDVVYIESLERLPWSYGFRNPKVVSEVTPRCRFLLSLCFNPWSVRGAQQAGMDAERLQTETAEYLRQNLRRPPAAGEQGEVNEQWIAEAFDGRLSLYLDAGRQRVTSLWTRVAEIIRGGGASVQRMNTASLQSSRADDLDVAINRCIDRVDLQPQSMGDSPRACVQAARERIADGGHVFAALEPGTDSRPEQFEDRIRYALDAGADGVDIYNYGLLREEQLQFVGRALKRCV